jgi:hypothetical protein
MIITEPTLAPRGRPPLFRARAIMLAATTVAAGMMAAGDARADDAAQAEELFQRAKALMQRGGFAEACPKLVQAQALHGGGGTLLALAMCHEGEGKLGSALLEFREAHALATRTARRDRAELAEERIRALEPRVSRLVPVFARRGGVTVQIDGVTVRDEQWTSGVPVDGGEHVVRAAAPGKRAWTTRTRVASSGQSVRVEIPELADGASPDAPPTQPARPARDERSALMLPGVATAIAGVAALGVGTYFGVAALGKKSESRPHCQGTVCDPTGYALNDDAKRDARVADIVLGAGAVVAATGALLIVLGARRDAPDGPVTATAFALPGGGGAALQGAF